MLTIQLIMGPTLSGKTYLSSQLQKLGVPRLITNTNRPMRAGEHNGVDYYFVSHQQAQNDINNHVAVAPRSYHVANGQTWTYYLKLDSNKIQQIEQHHHQVSLILDLPGFLKLEKYLTSHQLTNQITIHPWCLVIPLKTRLKRYIDGPRQNEDPKEVIRRLYDDTFRAFKPINNINFIKAHHIQILTQSHLFKGSTLLQDIQHIANQYHERLNKVGDSNA